MAWTDAEKKRVQELENALAKQTTALANVASKRQLSHALTLLKKENAELKKRIEDLESQIELLKQ